MRKLDRYIATSVLVSTSVILLVLGFLDILFSFLNQLDSVGGNYQTKDALIYTMLMTPRKLYELIPVSSMVGCLAGLGAMASNSELVVMRAAGISLWRILYSVAKPAFALIVFGFILGQYIAPLAEQVGETQRAIARSNSGTYSGEGFWHREGNEFMYFNAVEPNGVLHGVSRYSFNEAMELQSSSYADRGIYQGDHWILENVATQTRVGDEFVTTHQQTAPWNTSLSTTILSVVTVKPEALPLTGLYTYTDYLREQGLDAGEYQLAFWTKALQPLSILSLVLVGISFVFGPLRSVSMGQRLFMGVLSGVSFMIIQNLVGPTSLVFGLPPVLAVIVPILFCFMIGATMLRRAG